MKKLIAFVVAIMCAFPMFAFVGCTDKEPEQRKLTTVEQQLVGYWYWSVHGEAADEYEFKADGTYRYLGYGWDGTFKAIDKAGYYEIEVTNKHYTRIYYYYPSEEPDKLFRDATPDSDKYLYRSGTKT
ncbi:MAG: hypothetical protein K2F90_00300 [Clostridiales bacterium]|nr:hypothetical protein [Clostridiales bacterium]